MSQFNRLAADDIVSRIGLTPENRGLAEHWLTLWRENELPDRASFRPSDVRHLLRNIAIFDVVPEKSVTVRLAGTTYARVLGMELTGMDWLALAPPDYRAQRLRNFTEIAAGAICRAVLRVEMSVTGDYVCEELLLPFRCDAGSNTHPVLCHIGWNPQYSFVEISSRAQAMGVPHAFELFPIERLAQ